MLFFISLAYIAISVDVSGLIKYMAYKVLNWGGSEGYRLYFYLYAFFFSLTTFIGNDPIILSGTPFLAYMTRVSSNIKSPRAWIFAQFSVANIASTILVSSNPTNLVVAGAFQIKFINYSANVIVPTIATGIALFPFLLYIYFHNDALIPKTIEVHSLPDESKGKQPTNPNIPYSRGTADEQTQHQDSRSRQAMELEEILNPFLDRTGAIVGASVMAVTLITVLAVNAALASSGGEIHVFWIVLPAAVAMFFFDVWWGWRNRHETRKVAREGRLEMARARRIPREIEERKAVTAKDGQCDESISNLPEKGKISRQVVPHDSGESDSISVHNSDNDTPDHGKLPVKSGHIDEKKSFPEAEKAALEKELDEEDQGPSSLQSIIRRRWQWCRETFPTASTVLSMLPLPLVPFAFSMFVLVQALVTKGWVPVFAYGWDHWVNKTGTVGAIGGMGFISVVLCNVSPHIQVF
jgi:Na+/H+ antiporter NhaD/arsenite permease-like protein